jgi:hypothetical protein
MLDRLELRVLLELELLGLLAHKERLVLALLDRLAQLVLLEQQELAFRVLQGEQGRQALEQLGQQAELGLLEFAGLLVQLGLEPLVQVEFHQFLLDKVLQRIQFKLEQLHFIIVLLKLAGHTDHELGLLQILPILSTGLREI